MAILRERRSTEARPPDAAWLRRYLAEAVRLGWLSPREAAAYPRDELTEGIAGFFPGDPEGAARFVGAFARGAQ